MRLQLPIRSVGEGHFIVQTAGCKDYYLRENTVSLAEQSSGQLDLRPFARERSPLQTARLIEGDCLYIPARWWHMARCVEDSLSISPGVLRSPCCGASA